MADATNAEISTNAPAALNPGKNIPEIETIGHSAEDISNPGRRELFQNIIPAAGQGLAKLLRASNLLKHEIQESLQNKK